MHLKSSVDLRAARRFAVSCPILIKGENVRGRGTLINLSVWGCAVRASLTVQRGDRCGLTLTMPDEGTPVAIELARVRWCVGQHCGIEFLTMPAPARSRLRRFLLALYTRTQT